MVRLPLLAAAHPRPLPRGPPSGLYTSPYLFPHRVIIRPPNRRRQGAVGRPAEGDFLMRPFMDRG